MSRSEQTGQFVPEDTLDRFWRKVEVKGDDDCWEWTASRDHCGYGMFWMGERTLHATRALWVLLHGSIPDGLFVCHKCDNPGCCNPRHLWLGTGAENTQDKFRKGRAIPGLTNKCKGEQHANSKLAEQDVRGIRKQYEPGKYGAIKQLAKRYDVKTKTIWDIATGKTWRHVK